MLIKEIELNNFRVYKGKNIINLNPNEDQNIIIVSGKNGYGKTTFLVSLVWCLYGKQMIKVDDLYQKEISDKGSYVKYITGCLNRKSKLEGKTSFSVSVTIQDVKIPDVECKEVKIIRSYDTATSSGDKVRILIDGYENQITSELGKDNQSGEEVFIRDFILPIEIAKFFLFDAEKIVSLAEINSLDQRRQLSKAYSEVLGIKKYEDIKDELEMILDDYRKKSASREEKQNLNNIKARIENCSLEDKTLTDNIDLLKEEKDEKRKESDEIQTKLVREGKMMTLEELENLRQEEQGLRLKTEDLRSELKNLYDFIPFGLSGEVLSELTEQLKREKDAQTIQYKQDDIQEKTDKIINDIEREREQQKIPFENRITNFYSEQIKKQLKKHFFSDLPEIADDFQMLHNITASEHSEINDLANRLRHSFKSQFERINNEFYVTEVNLKSISRKIRDAEKDAEDDYIRNLREKKEQLDKRIIEIEHEIEANNQEIGKLRIERGNLIKEQDKLREKIDSSIAFSEKEEATKHVLKQVKKTITSYQRKKKESLEENMLVGLNILLHKKDFIKKVSVDINQSGEDIDISLMNERYEKIDKGSLSMGERQMYASALLSALVDESDIEFPIFIDSPMQKFDADHAENIIKYFYPNVSKQVVIFPLMHKELTEKEYELLKHKVSKVHIIQSIDNDSSQFLEVEPDKFLEIYKTL
jgi:DNA sulfur modification protein DndD